LEALDSGKALLLYEPHLSKHEINDCGIDKGCVWATVSPMKSRYKEYLKCGAVMKFMECPSENEVLFMASVLACGFAADNPLKDYYQKQSTKG
jgi:hypothetical protein